MAILLIQGEKALRIRHSKELSSEGYSVLPVSNLRDGAAILEHHSGLVSIILCYGQSNPGESSVDILPCIRETYPNIPIVKLGDVDGDGSIVDAVKPYFPYRGF